MTYDFNSLYLYLAQKNLADLFDYSINYLHKSLNEFWFDFVNSEVAKRYSDKDCLYISGRSGGELMCDLYHINEKLDLPFYENKSREYWLGYYIAQFQFLIDVSYYEISKLIDINNVYNMYEPYHTMDISSFIRELVDRYFTEVTTSKLKSARMNIGMSQGELAKSSGVSVRTIQQYEQKRKDINKASVSTLVALTKPLHCSVEDLLEINVQSIF